MARRFAALVVSCTSGILSVNDVSQAGATLNEVGNFTTTGNAASAVSSSQYNLLFLRDSTTSIRVLNSTTGAQLNLRSPSATGGFTDFALSPSGRYLFAADYGGTNIGYNTPANPSYVNRYDLQTGTWSSAQAPAIGHKIAAVDDSRVLLLGVDQWVDLTLNTYTPGAMTQLSKISPGYSGNVEYSASLGRIIHNETGISSTDIRAFTLSGNAMTAAEATSGLSYGGSYGVLSSDGSAYYYAQKELNAANLNQTIATFAENITAAAPSMAFGATRYFNPATGAVLGSIGFTPLTWTVDPNGRDVWAVEKSGTNSILHHYVIAQASQWATTGGGSWADPAKWSGNKLPDGMDNTADFSQVVLAADATVTLDGTRTIGHLILGDAGNARNWTIAPGTGGVLSMQVTGGVPDITVTNQTATVNAVIAGSQGLLKNGAGTLVLGAGNTYTGGTTIGGGTLAVSADSNLGGGPLTIAAGTFRAAGNLASARAIALQNASSAVQVDGGFTYTALAGAAVSGTGGLTKLGAGTLDLTAAAVTYTGTTTVNAGTLNLNSLSSTAPVAVASGGTLNLVNTNLTLGSLTNAGNVNFTNPTGTITLATLTGNGTTSFAAGAVVSTLSGGTINVAGPASITTASGGVANLNGATAAIGTLNNTAVNLAAGTALSVSAGTQTAGGISGSGGLTKSGAGSLILGYDNTYTGGTTVAAGTLQIGNGATAGSVVGNITNNGALVFSRSDAYTFGGLVSGSGTLRQSGAGTLTLTGSNTYAGGTTVSSGTLAVSVDSNLGSGSLAIATGTFKPLASISSARSIALQGTASTIQVDSGLSYTALAGATITGAGGLTKTGGGTLDLSAGATSYTGATNVTAGTLNVGSFASTGLVTVASGAAFNAAGSGLTLGTVANAGNINFTNPSGTITLAALSGNGTTSFAGGATVPTLSSGIISVAGAANVATASGGSATFGGGVASIGTLGNTNVNLLNGTNLSVATGTQTAGGINGLGSLTKSGTGTLVLGADNAYTGGTIISGGTLQVGSGATAGSVTGNITNNGSLVFNRSDSYTFGGLISGSGAVRQNGAGTLSLTGANTYAGGTTISSGTLQLGDGTTAGSVTGNVVNNAALAFNTPAAGQTFSGSISGSGSIVKLGPGTQILTGLNTNTGNTTVSEGVLQVGNGGTSGNITGSVTNNAALVFKRSDNVGFTGVILGSGHVEQAGSGTLSLLGNVTSDLKVSAGRVVVSTGATFSGDVTTLAAARVENGGGTIHVGNLDNAGIFSGTTDLSGTFVNRPTGNVRLTPGQSMVVQNNSPHTNAGLIEALGNGFANATFETDGRLTNASGGTSLIAARNATLRFNNGLTNQGAVSFSYGVSDLFGDVDNQSGGTIAVAGGAGVTFYDDVVQNGAMSVSAAGGTRSSAVFLGSFTGSGGFTGGGDVFFMGDLRPGNSPAEVTYGGNVSMGSSSRTIMEIAGTNGGSQYDRINVAGTFTVGGQLQIALANGFTPLPGQSFDLVNASVTSGRFDSLSLPALPYGMLWETSDLYTSGTISAVASPNSPITTVKSGVMTVKYASAGTSAASPLLSGLGGADIQNGEVVFDYTGDTSPAATIRGLLKSSFDNGSGVMKNGQLRSSTATTGRGLGYADDGAGRVRVMATLFGDADLDGGVSINDFNALAANFGQASGKVWLQGDFDYDGGISINDFNLLASNFGKTLQTASGGPNYAALVLWDFAVRHNDQAAFIAATGVPEPTAFGLLAVGATMALRRRRA